MLNENQIKELLDKGLLDKRVRVIITGHTH